LTPKKKAYQSYQRRNLAAYEAAETQVHAARRV
jgi:hypothetical protein